MPPNHFICSCCGKRKPIEQRILLGGDALCYACAEEFTTLCDRCGERVYRRDARQVNNRTVCLQGCGQIRKSHTESSCSP